MKNPPRSRGGFDFAPLGQNNGLPVGATKPVDPCPENGHVLSLNTCGTQALGDFDHEGEHLDAQLHTLGFMPGREVPPQVLLADEQELEAFVQAVEVASGVDLRDCSLQVPDDDFKTYLGLVRIYFCEILQGLTNEVLSLWSIQQARQLDILDLQLRSPVHGCLLVWMV